MAAEYIPPADSRDVLREQLDLLIAACDSGKATNAELRRFSFIHYQLMKPFERQTRK
jgi:hypothetical protein